MSATLLRPATVDDHALYTRFFAELGTPEGPFDRERWQAESAPTTVFLEDGGVAVAYAFWEGESADVLVRHVVVDRAARGRGFGRKLMLELAALLAARGARTWRLNVRPSNAVAIGLYESLGLRRAFATAVLRLMWRDAVLLPRGAARAAPSSASSAAECEARFGLYGGELAAARARAGVHVIEARTPDGALVGIAAFDPHYPGARPFRVTAGEHARALIDAMKERYEGPQEFVQLVVEDDAATARMLEQAGAACLFEIAHMRGEIPR